MVQVGIGIRSNEVLIGGRGISRGDVGVVGVQGERKRIKSRKNRGKGWLRINRRFRAKKLKASKSFSFWQAVTAQAEEG